MTSNAELIRVQRELTYPGVCRARLWEIAQNYPDMQAFVALYAGTPPDLLDWLIENSTPAIRQAAAERKALGEAWKPEPPRILGIPISVDGWWSRKPKPYAETKPVEAAQFDTERAVEALKDRYASSDMLTSDFEDQLGDLLEHPPRPSAPSDNH